VIELNFEGFVRHFIGDDPDDERPQREEARDKGDKPEGGSPRAGHHAPRIM
jgi:hypothetical protein